MAQQPMSMDSDIDSGTRASTVGSSSLLRRYWPIAGILLVASWVRFGTSRDLWIDEMTSIIQATAPNLADVVGNAPVMHPPLYHMSLHLWMSVFGSGPLAVRSLSIVVGVLAVAAVYVLGVRFLGRNQGTIAAFIAAIAPFHVWYSQEVRMYVFVLLFATLSMYFFLRLLDGDRRTAIWVAYIVATILTIYSHYSGLILLLLEVSFAVFIWLTRRGSDNKAPASKSRSIRWVIIGLVLIAPLAALFFTKFLGSSLHEFIAQNSFPVTMGTLSEVLVGYHTIDVQLKQSAAWSLALYIAPLAMLGSRQLMSIRTQFLVWVVVGTVVLVYLASEIIHPLLMHPRFFSPGFPALVLLLATALTSKHDKIRKIPFAIVIGVLVIATYDQGTNLENRMRYQNVAALQYVADAYQPGDVVILTPPYADRIFDYYDVDGLDAPIQVPTLPGLGEEEFDVKEEIERSIKDKQRVFYIYTFDNLDPRIPPVVIDAKEILRKEYPLESSADFNNIEIRCYSRGIECPPSIRVGDNQATSDLGPT